MSSFVPRKSVIAGLVSVSVVGAVFTLVHQPAAKTADYHAKTSTSAEITPSLSAEENAQLDIKVNGQEVPTTNGTTTVPVPGGTASVHVHGNSASVTTSGSGNVSASTPSGNLNISVQSHSNGGSNFSHSSQSFSSSNSSGGSSFSSIQVSGNGAQVEIHSQ